MYQFSYPFHNFVFDFFQIFGSCACNSYFGWDYRFAVSYDHLASEFELFTLKVDANGNDLGLCHGSDESNACFALSYLTVL